MIKESCTSVPPTPDFQLLHLKRDFLLPLYYQKKRKRNPSYFYILLKMDLFLPAINPITPNAKIP